MKEEVLTTKPKYDYVVYIGRFSPLHKGHVETIQKAFKNGKHVIVLIGSAHRARDIKNPWTWGERKTMIEQVYYSKMIPHGGDASERMTILPLKDYLYNDQQWFTDVQTTVNGVISHTAKNKIFLSNEKTEHAVVTTPTVAVIGYDKDHSSYYLKNFPQWDYIEMENVDGLNGTDIRDTYLGAGLIPAVGDFISEEVATYLREFKKTDKYELLANEFKFIKNYKSQFSGMKYPPIFVTTDAVVIQSGHVLLVTRKSYPGKGLWAIPGGFLKNDERILDGMIRELREETKLKVPVPVLKGSVKDQKCFDAPERSLRGRTLTHAFLIELESGELPKVKGSDDAEKAFWLPLAEALNQPEMFFEDHFMVLKYFVGEV